MASGDSSRVPMLQNWNPMMEDYESDFNSYDTGPGRDLPTSLQRPRRSEVGAGDTSTPSIDDLVQLYVTGIPDEMSDEGLANLFSQSGKVLYAHKIVSANRLHDTSYGFVKYARPDEAAAAIAKFNRFRLQQYELHVSVALNSEQKAQRAERKKKQEDFLNSLNSSNSISDNGVAPPGRNTGISANGHVTTPNMNTLGRGIMTSSPITDGGLGNRPQFNQSPGVTTPRVPGARNATVGMGRGLGQFQMPRDSHAPSRSSGYSSDAGSVHGDGVRPVARRQTPCHVCRKIGTLRCSKCKETSYCGRECQLRDWPYHQMICVTTSSQEREFERQFDVDVDFLPEPVRETRLWRIDDLRRESLPSEFTLVVLMDVVSPNNFCVVKDSLTPQLQTLKDEMNLFFDDTTNHGPGSYVPALDEVCAARYDCDGEWYRVHVHRIAPNGSTFDVTYVDFGNLETVNVTDMRRIQPDMTSLPLQAIRCSLELRPPSDVQQIANFNRLSAIMLNTDKKYNCQPIGVTAGTHTVLVKLLSLDGNENIAEFIVRQNVGVRGSSPAPVRNDLPDPVRNDLPTSAPVDSGKLKLRPGQSVRLPPSKPQQAPKGAVRSAVASPTGRPAPMETAPKETAPKETAPKEIAPKETAPKETAPKETAPKETAPKETAPKETAPKETAPKETAPKETAPKETAPVPPVPLSVLSPLPSATHSLPVADGKASLRVQVLEVVTPDYFFVHLLDDDSNKLTALHKNMMAHYEAMPPNTLFRIQQSPLYAARFDGSWYRALAYNAQGNTVCVQYLDYGNRESVSFAEIHPLEPRFCTLPHQAVCCALTGIRPKSGDWTEALTGAFRDELLSSGLSTVCAYEKDRGVLMVELRCDKTPAGATINKQLLSRGLVVAKNRDGVRPGATSDAPANADKSNRKGATDRKKSGENIARDGNKRVQATKASSPTKRVSSPTQQTLKSPSPTKQMHKASSQVQMASSPTKQMHKAASPAMQPQKPSPTKQIQKASSPAQQTKTSDLQPKAHLSGQKPAAEKSKPTVAMLATIKPPADCTVLIVTASSGPEDITVQFVQADLVEQGQALAAQLEALHGSYSGTYAPVVGELICAKFSADGTWYRAEVLQVKGEVSCVRFIDYGNTDDVTAPSMSAWSDSLLAYPVMGVKCRLEGVGTAPWDESVMKPFQPWSIKQNGTMPDKIELFDQESGARLCLVLVSGVPSVALTLRNIKVPERERIHIRVTDAADPDHVNVQIVEEDYIPDMMQLIDELAKIASSPLRSCNPGDVVCARFSADNDWYRAIVLELIPEGAKVRFLDYGNMEVTPVARLAAMPEALMRFPVMSVACVLSEVSAIVQSEGWQCMFKLDLLMTIVGRADGGRIIVELFDAADGSSLNKKLVSSGVCTRAGVPVALASSLGKAVLPSGDEPFKVQVVEASKGHEAITVQVLEGALLESLSSLTVILEKKYASSAGGFTPTTVGELVCAKFDGQWYRAEVVSLKTSGGKICVHFIDYGNADELGIESVARVDSALVSYPVLGLRCRLAGVVGLALGSTWDEALVKPFNVIQMRVVDAGSAPICVELIDAGVSMNEHLVNTGVLLSGKPAENVSLETVTSPAAAVPSPMTPPSVTIGSLKHVTLPAAVKMCVQVTDVASQGRITVQLIESEYLADLTSLTKTIIDTYSDNTAPYAPRVGEVVCAKTGGDWYRGDVVAVNAGVASVHFFDFGNTDDVSFADVARITDDAIIRCPILGVECRLDVGPEWKNDSLVLFDPVLMTVVEAGGDGPALVELFNPETGASLTEKRIESVARTTPQTAPVTVTDLTMYVIPPGRVRVRVSDAASPRDVTIQVLQDDSLTALQSLGDALAACFAEYRDSYVPQCGEIVCARFALDNAWYRAEVLSIDRAARISVRFVDFGNSDALNVESVARITPELCAYPMLGIKCRLAGVGGMANDRSWDPDLLRPFEVLTLTVESANGDGCAIKLYDDVDCLNTRLINSGVLIAEPLPSSSHEAAASNTTPSEADESSLPVAPSSVTSNTKRVPTTSSRYPVKTSPIEQPPPYMKCLPTQPLPGDRPHVMPCHLESPHEFYVQSLDPECVAKFTSLNEAVGMHYDTLEPTAHQPKLGELIAAYCVADNAWYRAVVTEFYGDTHHKVVFVDYGNADLVTVGSVRRLDTRFAKLPRQAIRMSLFGMNSTDVRWSGVAIRSFSEEIVNKPCVVDIARRDGDVVVVSDIATSDGVSIIAKMVSDGHKILLPDDTASATHERVTEDIVKINEIANVQLSDAEEVTVCLVHAVGPSEFSVILIDNQPAVTMQVKLNEHCKADSRAYVTFAQHDVVCALYENVWYRSVVLEAPSDGGLTKLCFFDFGNTERVSSEHIRRMPRHFATVPQQAIPCSLGNVAALSGQWSSKAVDWFAQLVDKCFKAKRHGIKDGRHLVDLQHDDPTGKNVAQEIISLQFGTSVVPPGSRPTLAQRSNLVSVAHNGPSAPPTGGNVYRLTDLPALVSPDEMDVVVVEVTNPGLFFCHHATLEAMNRLNELITQMDERCNKLPVDVTFDPQPGEMCCALFKGNWYRAVIEHRQANKASLFFVDFGNSSLEDVTNLRCFSRELCTLPPQAIKCTFAGLKPNGPKWTPEATLLFKSLVVVGDTPLRLYMIVVERPADGGALSVKLVDTTGEELNGRDIGTELAARLSTTVAASEPQPAAPLSLEDENAKLKRELEELKRMMQQNKF